MSGSEPAPRFEAHELEGNVRLKPSHRLLYVGIGVVLVGIIVLLAISIADNRDEPPAPPASSSQVAPGSGATEPAATASTVRLESSAPAVGSAEPAPGPRATIHLHVVSTPAGAEVSLSGKPLGVTPLDIDVERRTGSEPLTIHRARYQDVSHAVDLGRDVEQTVALVPVAEPGTARTQGGSSGERSQGGSTGTSSAGPDRPSRSPQPADRDRPTRPSRDGGGTRRTGLPPKEDCQPPDKFNPYEAACHGHVCKPCPVAAP